MENRSIVTAIILSIVTCGIYSIYWFYTIAKGFNETYAQEKVSTTPGVSVLLMMVTCNIYAIYCYYKWGRASTEISGRYGRVENDKAIIYLLLSIFGFSIVVNALIQNDFNNWIAQGPPDFQARPL